MGDCLHCAVGALLCDAPDFPSEWQLESLSLQSDCGTLLDGHDASNTDRGISTLLGGR